MNADFSNTACIIVKRTSLCCWWRVMQYFKKGAANLCGMVELINEQFSDETRKKELEDRLMPRTEELPLHTTHEFNAKVRPGAGAVDVRLSMVQLSIYSFSTSTISINMYVYTCLV